MWKKGLLFMALCLLLAGTLAFIGCETPEEEVEEEEPAVDNPAKDQRDDVFIHGDGELSGIFNPVLSATVYDSYIVQLAFDPLFAVDEEGNITTENRSVASEADMDEDGTVTIELEEGILFHDGEELTAEDVAFTWEAVAHPDYDGPRRATVNNIQGIDEITPGDDDEEEDIQEMREQLSEEGVAGVEIVDDHTLVVESIEPLAVQKDDINVTGVMPKHHYKWDFTDPEAYADEFQALNMEPMGSGPYVFDEYVTDERAEFTAFEDYFLGEPATEQFIYDEYDDLGALIPALEAGDVDAIDYQTDVESYEMVDDIEHAMQVQHLNNGYAYISVHQEHPVLGEQEVRQALMYGLDRGAWVEGFFGELGQVAHTSLAPASWAYPGDEAFEHYEYDPDKANELLDEAGFDEWCEDEEYRLNDDGEPIELTYETYEEADWSVEIPEIAQDQWGDLGLDVTIEMSDCPTLQESTQLEQDFDIYNMAFNLAADPDPYELFHSDFTDPGEFNSMQYKCDEADELMEEGRREFDREERKEIYQELFTHFNEDLPMLFVYFRDETYGVNQRVDNFQPTEFQDWTWNVHEISVDY